MAQLDARQPNRIFRGTVDEVFSHRSEIPAGATVELRVVEAEAGNDFEGKTLADVLQEIGTVKGLPDDLSVNPEYFRGFGEPGNLCVSKP